MKRLTGRFTSHLDPNLVASVAVGAFLAPAAFEGVKYVIGVTMLTFVLIRGC